MWCVGGGSRRPRDLVRGRGYACRMSKPAKDAPRLYLVDGSGYIFRAYHALPPLSRSDGLPIGAVAGFCNMLYKFLEDMKGPDRPTHLVVVFDKSEQTFRKDFYPEYKAHRPPPPDDLIPQFGLIREAVTAFNVPMVELDGFEADDIIATYARAAAAQGAMVRIVSSDKDLMQLVEDGRIELFDPMKNKPIGPAEVEEKFGVAPEKVIDVQALMGDSVDNVPGCPGIGQKTAAELIGQYGSVEALIERAEEIKQPKRRENIIAYAEAIRISKALVTLKDDVALAQGWEVHALHEPETAALLAFLDQMEFKTLSRRVREKLGASGEAAPRPAHAPADEPPLNYDSYRAATFADLEAFCARAATADRLGLALEAEGADLASARLIGISLALGANDALYVPLGHVIEEGDLFGGPAGPQAQPGGGNLPLDRVLALLRPLLEDRAVLKVGHDLKTAIGAFANLGVAVAGYDDTQLLSYALGAGLHAHDCTSVAERLLGHKAIGLSEVTGSGKGRLSFAQVPIPAAARYSAEDADLALRLHTRLKRRLAEERLNTVYERLDRPLPGIVAEMERAGIKVDLTELSRLSGDFAQRMLSLEAEAYDEAGDRFNIGSPKQLGDILFGQMKLPGGKKTKTGAWSTDADILESLAAEGHRLPKTVLDWRQLAKLRSTYTEALREAVNPQTGRVHTSYQLAATTTGRLSSSEPNLQNIPIRTEEGRRIREAFIPEPGHVLISADYSQIELRLLAFVANIPELKRAFAEGVDIHALTASEMFGVPVQGMPGEIRRQAKAINFGIIYGISAFGLANNLGIPQAEASAYIKRYFERFPGIRDYMERTKNFAREHGFVTTIFGRRCWVPAVRSRNMTERQGGERQAINAPLQGAAADIIKRAMIRLPGALAQAGLSARMLLQVHDELVFEAPAAEAEETCALVKAVMEKAAEPAAMLDVPLTVEAKAGPTWGAAH